MTVVRSHLSKEYVRYPVRAKVQGVEVDPTQDAVQFAFPVRGLTPAPGDFVSGGWETDNEGKHWAACLVGPGGAFVPAQTTTYDVWIKITDSPEIPARRIDLLVCP